MAFINYSKYKILIDPQSKNMQGLKTGDIVRRQYFDNPNLIYTLMLVLETGIEVIGGENSPYFIGALLEGDEPKNGELLDFVRITNLFDTDRSGALYLTASDSEAPYMDVIDGLAIENSLCFPRMGGGNPAVGDESKYALLGDTLATAEYISYKDNANRVLHITKNATINTTGLYIGLKQTLAKQVTISQRIIITYKIRSSKVASNIPISFGYTSGANFDGKGTISINSEWSYQTHVISIDYPSEYSRSFYIDLRNLLKNDQDWCEVAELNIIELSSVSNFSKGSKVRVGKIKGVIDPVFGVLEGYGAYFQNMYATKNVNIAGTLTAGDENGFSSTFYVGKIHKNVIQNSIDCVFRNGTATVVTDNSPVGIGKAWSLGKDVSLVVQTKEWRNLHLSQVYCFSFWAKSMKDITLSLTLDSSHLSDLIIPASADWKRYQLSGIIKDSTNTDTSIRFLSTIEGLRITAPQFEYGKTASQYQPTDGTLAYVEDYGAWFSKGGIGGTIQNPLLKLNEDGSISSRDGSFVINPDGTGQFASGKFKWDKNTITLQDIVIRWEDFDDETKDNLTAKSVKLSGVNMFHYQSDNKSCEPKEITVIATENNFTSTESRWLYLSAENIWKEFPQKNKNILLIYPDAHYWEERTLLTIKYISVYNGLEYSDNFTITKVYDGEDSYTIYIESSNGLMFKNGIISTMLKAVVYKAGEDISHTIPNNSFTWKRVSNNASEDLIWNSMEHKGMFLEITGNDVTGKAIFDCEVII